MKVVRALAVVAVCICVLAVWQSISTSGFCRNEAGVRCGGTETHLFGCMSYAVACGDLETTNSFSPHPAIFIGSDAEFTSSNGVSAGTGTLADPYIIEGLEINANGTAYAISVMNTNAHFIIRNCRLFNATSSSAAGISLNNVRNGTLSGNNCTSNHFGINIMSTSNCAVQNCTANNCSIGIAISYSSNVSAIYNSACGNLYYGINSDHCTLNKLEENNVSHNGMIGAYLYSSERCTLKNNTIVGNNMTGIRIYQSGNNTITGNFISNSVMYGLHISASPSGISMGNVIHHNAFIGNHGAGKTRDNAHVQAWDESGPNIWNGSAEGNYWSDWTSPDISPKDGIVDAPYIIDGGGTAQDNRPLAEPPFYIVPDNLSCLLVVSATYIAVALYILSLFCRSHPQIKGK